MAKKSIKPIQQNNTKKPPTSKKQTKQTKRNSKRNKKQQPQQQEQQIDEDEDDVESEQRGKNGKQHDNDSENGSGQNDSDEGQQSDDEEDDSDQESQEESSSQLAPQNLAIRQMKFRQKRGTKMNYLMNKKKLQEEDQFWKNQGQNYFGNFDEDQNQDADQDYQQSSSGRDQFDSDFDQTQSEHNDEEENKREEPQVQDQDRLRQKKKQQQLMIKIGAQVPKKGAPATKTAPSKPSVPIKKPALNQQSQKKPSTIPQVVTNRYIHQVCTQQQLLGEAAQTQYINWLSLKKLISIQNQKKDFAHKQHFIEGSKIIYRDRIGQNGKRCSEYELVGLQVKRIEDLTEILGKKDQQGY